MTSVPRRRIICICLLLILLFLTGCGTSKAYPPSEETVRSAAEQLGWSIDPEETQSWLEGQILYTLISDDQPKTTISFALVDGNRMLTMHCFGNKTSEKPEFAWEDWKAAISLVESLYDGFSEGELYKYLIQQGIPDSGDMELSPPLRSRETVADALAQAQIQLAAARSATDRLTGQLHAMGDPDGLRASAESLQSQIGQLQEEYDALRLAMDTLTGANTVLQNRFSPQLSRRTAEIFHELTEGRYTAAALDRSFHLTARPAGDPIDRDIQLLSAGAADQLYLSARLAICELVLPLEKSIPIILDDALTNFDNERCAAALRWLKQAAAHRQILLFTCHSREADFFAGDLEVAVQRL